MKLSLRLKQLGSGFCNESVCVKPWAMPSPFSQQERGRKNQSNLPNLILKWWQHQRRKTRVHSCQLLFVPPKCTKGKKHNICWACLGPLLLSPLKGEQTLFELSDSIQHIPGQSIKKTSNSILKWISSRSTFLPIPYASCWIFILVDSHSACK